VHDREHSDHAVRVEHEQAVARGEERVLRTTDTGELHSYPGEEIGFTPGRGHPQVSTWWGMGVLTAVMGALFVFSWAIVLAPLLLQEQQPYWAALFLVVLSGLGGWYTFGLARGEYRASRLRKERGSPPPGRSGHLPS
jgi:hypothetical protein